jgi:Amidases related to nicotinamidase
LEGATLSNRFHPHKDNVALVLVDFQEKMLAAMEEEVRKKVSENVGLLVDLAKLMHIPVVVTEQYPKGLGKTIGELARKLGALYQPIEKTSFSCYAHPPFVERIKKLGVTQVALTGIETHVCVLQTAIDLLEDDYEVSVVSDAVCSRHKSDWKVGLRMIEQAGGVITSTEIIIFQLLNRADTAEFKFMSPLLKQR